MIVHAMMVSPSTEEYLAKKKAGKKANPMYSTSNSVIGHFPSGASMPEPSKYGKSCKFSDVGAAVLGLHARGVGSHGRMCSCTLVHGPRVRASLLAWTSLGYTKLSTRDSSSRACVLHSSVFPGRRPILM